MRLFRLLPSLLLAALLLATGRPAAAQNLSIEQLLELSTPVTTSAGTLHPGTDLSYWTFEPKTPQAAEEKLTWGWQDEYSSDTTRVLSCQLSLRPAPQGFDVLLYVHRLPVYNQLRRELEKKRFVALPVTCLGGGCVGFRYTLPTATIAFYEGKPGDYPFVIVVQPRAGRTLPVPPPVPGAPGQTVKNKTKTKPRPEPESTVLATDPASARR